MRISILGGGTSGARFVRDIASVASLDVSISAIVPTAGDLYAYGLKSCPDLDAILTELDHAPAAHGANVAQQLRAFNVEPTWLTLDDRTIALSIVRTEMMAAGYTLTEVTAALAARLGIGVSVLPMSNDRIETNIVIADGDGSRAVHVHEYLARYSDKAPEALVPIGLDKALATDEAVAAIGSAQLIVLAPCSPVLGLEPILRLPALYDALNHSDAKVLGVPWPTPDHEGLAELAGVAASMRLQYDDIVDRWASGTAAEVLSTGRELIAR